MFLFIKLTKRARIFTLSKAFDIGLQYLPFLTKDPIIRQTER